MCSRYLHFLFILTTSSDFYHAHTLQDATFFEGNGLESWNVAKVQFFNYAFSRATNANPMIGFWNTQSAEFLEGMFEYAVSFNQNISAWDLSSAVSVEGMLEGTSNFAQKLCWNSLADEALVTNLFCDSHAAARFDPCCTSAYLIDLACCHDSGVCDTYCPTLDGTLVLEEGSGAVSNDGNPPLLAGIGNGGATVLAVSVVNGNEAVTTTPTNDDETSTTTTTDEASSNATPEAPADNGPAPVPSSGMGVQSETLGNSEENKNAWQEYLWLRILVYLTAILILGNVFLYFLNSRRETMESRANEQSGAFPDDKNGDVWDKMVEEEKTEDVDVEKQGRQTSAISLVTGNFTDDDEMSDTMETKPSDDTGPPDTVPTKSTEDSAAGPEYER